MTTRRFSIGMLQAVFVGTPTEAGGISLDVDDGSGAAGLVLTADKAEAIGQALILRARAVRDREQRHRRRPS